MSLFSAPPKPDAPDGVCMLDHRAFHATGEVMFRRDGSDGTPVMVMKLGERDASLPLRALQRELSISDDSPDGRMLGLIAQALDFVPVLSLGDRLPAEVLTGEAHWSPAPHHRWIAASRLQIALVSWLSDPVAGEEGALAFSQQTMHRLITDPALRQAVQAAFAQAAEMLGLRNAAEAVALVDQLAHELAYIEALRESLLGRVQDLVRRLARTQSWSQPGRHGQRRLVGQQRRETVQRVGFLAASALRQFATRFAAVDAQTGSVLQLLRNATQQILFIRQHRDALFIDASGWDAVLTAWDGCPDTQDDALWECVQQTYHLLATRHLPLIEWRRVAAPARLGRHAGGRAAMGPQAEDGDRPQLPRREVARMA